MIILSKRVGQVSSNQPLGDENNGPQDSRLTFVSKVRRIANSMFKDKRKGSHIHRTPEKVDHRPLSVKIIRAFPA